MTTNVINKENVLKTYGEYDIPFEIAKQLPEYKFTLNKPLEDIQKKTKLFIKEKNFDIIKDLLDVLFVLEFGSIDIELQYYDVTESDEIDAGFFTCVQKELHTYPNSYDNSTDDGWCSHKFSDLNFDTSMLDDLENLEKLMYTHMINVARNDKLYWSKRNKLN